MWEQRARAAGWPAGWRLPDEVIEASRLAVLGDHRGGRRPLGIYSYGSLMWDPGFHFAEVRLADVEGYQRRFTLKINLGRGSQRLSGADAFAGAAARTLPRAGVPHRRRFSSMPKRRSCGAARCCAAAMRRRWCRCSRRRARSRRLPSSRTLRTRAMSANCRLPRPQPDRERDGHPRHQQGIPRATGHATRRAGDRRPLCREAPRRDRRCAGHMTQPAGRRQHAPLSNIV